MMIKFKPRLVKLDSFGDLSRELDQLIEGVFSERPGATCPRIDLLEDDTKFTVVAELPGFTEQDVEVSLNDNVLGISGQREFTQERADKHVHVSERCGGRFERQVRLPKAVDEANVEATLKNGVLKVVLHKRDAASVRRIEVNK